MGSKCTIKYIKKKHVYDYILLFYIKNVFGVLKHLI